MNLVIIILLSHYLGDFVFQPRQVAELKSKSNLTLLYHVLIYSSFIWAGSIYFMGIEKAAQYMSLNMILHFLIDYFTSRLNVILWQKEDKHAFWCSVGFDQFLHQSCLLLTLYLFR